MITIGELLLARLSDMGVRHIFGVPGDFNLQFLEQVSNAAGIEFIGTCNELNAAYAADGYARLNGIGALLTTYGVGELSAICGVAGACAEHVPVVCITGAPPLHAMEEGLCLHHTLADGNYDNMMNCYRQFTVAQTRLTAANALAEIDRVLSACLREMKPVYIQLPSDVSHQLVRKPQRRLELAFTGNPEPFNAALQHLLTLWSHAKRPAVLIDSDAARFAMAAPLKTLVEKTQIPFASLITGKCILDETHPLWLGAYAGQGSETSVRQRIENSDCLIVTAPRFIETNSNLFTQSLPAAATVELHGSHVVIQDHVYNDVDGVALLERFVAQVEPRPITDRGLRRKTDWSMLEDAPLRQERLWPQLARFIREGDVVIAENGTSNIGLGRMLLPSGVDYVAANIWASIGFSLPAVLGTTLADPNRRHLLFIGDGSFQLTVQELSTILRLNLKPIIFLLNNRGYTIERYILGMNSAYNDIANWNYSQLPSVFAPQRNCFIAQVRTEGELAHALTETQACDRLALIEVHLDPLDAPEGLRKLGPVTADFDYGPCGPQVSERSANARISASATLMVHPDSQGLAAY
ncbi:MAG: alpha-keto acid decarboxylase family protein [Ferrovum sp.]|nr:alpha-keto acid decarboxylase family protein [Ferrovum sp.]